MGPSIENGGVDEANGGGGGTVEEGFKDHPVPSWWEQLTVRALLTSMVLSVVFNFIVMKLNLTTGVIPSMNVAAGLLGFAIVKGWTLLMDRCGLLKQPFTRQENTVIQTAVVASSGIAFSSGTASYLLGMTVKIAAQGDGGNTPNNVKHLSLGWIIAFLFTVSFVGLFSIMPLRKMMITKYKLTYPSGTATAFLINGFHTPKGAKLAKKQIGLLMKSFSLSFVFAAFQWFFAAGDGCGFGSFPTFGPQAFARRFYFDFSSTYVGVGMICPYMVNISLMIGAVFSWGFLWPFIESKKGDWYGAHLSSGSLHGIQGYRVFLAIAMMFGDGIFQVVYMTVKTLISLYQQSRTRTTPGDSSEEEAELSFDEKRQRDFFEKDEVPNWFAFLGYVVLAAVSMVVVPTIFHQLRWYHLLVVYTIAPVMAFCNAYGTGLSDWSLASNYGKIAIIIFSAWVGEAHGGIVAGLAACGVMMNIVSTASDLMQDFKTGYLTLSSPRSMFASQVFGTAVGCVSTPLVFWFFYKAYPIGDPTSSYPAPYALLYRGIALLGVEGISSLPKNCLTLAIVFFVAAILMNVLQQALRYWNCRAWRFVPSPMCIAIPFYLGGYFTVDMCLGSLILYIWERRDKVKAKDYAPAVASGMICGESLWSVPAALLALGGVKAPMCMKFLTSSVNDKVDTFLAGAGL